VSLSLHVTITPDVLPSDTACDVELRLALRNDGRKTIAVSPSAAKLAAIASFAGMGITWSIGFTLDGAAVPMQELRTYYGPPGNPPSPAWAKQQAVEIEAGAEHATQMIASWIPNSVLEPRHLVPAMLDPERMDNIAGPSIHAGHTALAERIPLARASVLVFGPPWAMLAPTMTKDDFLRGKVVAFFTQPGAYELRAQYAQMSWMDVGERLRVDAAPVAVRVG
jgi:hypothetical protein